MKRIGFIGLGIMGKPMATNLIRAGHRLVVHDINPTPASLAAEVMSAMKAAGKGGCDHGALIQYFENLAGLEVH